MYLNIFKKFTFTLAPCQFMHSHHFLNTLQLSRPWVLFIQPASLDLPVLPSSPIAERHVAGERLVKHILLLPIGRQFVGCNFKLSYYIEKTINLHVSKISRSTFEIGISFKLQSSSLEHCDVVNRFINVAVSRWRRRRYNVDWKRPWRVKTLITI